MIPNKYEITAIMAQLDGGREVNYSIRQMCALIEVSSQGKMPPVNDDSILAGRVKGINITLTPSISHCGGLQIVNCLPIDYLDGWSFGTDAKPEEEQHEQRASTGAH